MPTFELKHPDGRTFEVDAPNMQAAEAAIGEIKHGQPISQLEAATRGVVGGASAGWFDEMAGAAAAGGITDSDIQDAGINPMRAAVPFVKGAAKLLYEKVKGEHGPASEAYEKERDAERKRQKDAREQYPKTFIGGEIAGSLALPVGNAARAATFPVRLARGAQTGAVIGGLTGAGEGQGLEDSAVRAGVGTVAGGMIGAAGLPIAEGISRVVSPIASRIAAPVANEVRSLFRPREEAARQVAGVIEHDIKADPNAGQRLGASEWQAAKAQGMPVVAADMGGELTRTLADTAAVASPQARSTLAGLNNQRFESQSPRLASWLRETFNYPDAAAQQEAIEQAARAANKPAYARAASEAAKLHPQGLWDESFEQLSQDPAVQAAIRKANITSRSAAARQGISQGQPITPIRSPFVMDGNGRMVLGTGPNGERARPTLQYWDEVKKNLDKVGSFEARSMARVLRDHIDGLVPSYQAARAGAAHFFGAENALEAGQNFVGASARYGLPDARRAFAAMSPQERQLFQDGYVSRLVEKIEKTPDQRSVLNQIAQSPAAKAEINMAIGPTRAAELEARLRVEGMFDLLRNTVSGNSRSVQRWVNLTLASGGGGLASVGGYNQDPKAMAIGLLTAALGGGRMRINQGVMRHIAELLVGDPKQLAKGVRIVARNPRFLEALRATDREIASAADLRVSTAGAQQSSNLPAVQAGGVGAAQGNQDQVPRPPAQ
jgi:hypothetical protein